MKNTGWVRFLQHGIVLISALICAMAPAPNASQLVDVAASGGLQPDRYCLACLCNAASDCDVTVGCRHDNDVGTVCGPFTMSRLFWQDAKVATAAPKFADYAFDRCANDADCAGAAVSAYMQRYSRECDGDGRITCSDFGLMHYMGYGACAHAANVRAGLASKFYATFSACLKKMDGLLQKEEYQVPPGFAPTL